MTKHSTNPVDETINKRRMREIASLALMKIRALADSLSSLEYVFWTYCLSSEDKQLLEAPLKEFQERAKTLKEDFKKYLRAIGQTEFYDRIE